MSSLTMYSIDVQGLEEQFGSMNCSEQLDLGVVLLRKISDETNDFVIVNGMNGKSAVIKLSL